LPFNLGGFVQKLKSSWAFCCQEHGFDDQMQFLLGNIEENPGQLGIDSTTTRGIISCGTLNLILSLMFLDLFAEPDLL